jgi:hypothetical protein
VPEVHVTVVRVGELWEEKEVGREVDAELLGVV